MRILVTGCRYWNNYRAIKDTLAVALAQAQERGEKLYVRHGDCESGADRLTKCIIYAYNQAGNHDIVEEARPAHWQHPYCRHPKGTRHNGDWYCKAAGPIRNQEMVDEGGIDEVHAWPLAGGRGTQDCMARARDAGLLIFNHGVPLDIAMLKTQPIEES